MTLLQLFIRGVVVATFLLLAVVESAWTQAVSPASPVPPLPPGPASEGGAGQGLVAFIVVVGLLVLIGIVVKLYDMKRKREDEGNAGAAVRRAPHGALVRGLSDHADRARAAVAELAGGGRHDGRGPDARAP